MELSKKTKQHLDAVANELADVFMDVGQQLWKDVGESIQEEDPDYTKGEYIRSDWDDNGYEALDDITDYIAKVTTIRLKSLTKKS